MDQEGNANAVRHLDVGWSRGARFKSREVPIYRDWELRRRLGDIATAASRCLGRPGPDERRLPDGWLTHSAAVEGSPRWPAAILNQLAPCLGDLCCGILRRRGFGRVVGRCGTFPHAQHQRCAPACAEREDVGVSAAGGDRFSVLLHFRVRRGRHEGGLDYAAFAFGVGISTGFPDADSSDFGVLSPRPGWIA